MAGIMKDVDGLVLKPILKPEELEFYEDVTKNVDDDVLQQLKSFIPEYHGTKIVDGAKRRYSVSIFVRIQISISEQVMW